MGVVHDGAEEILAFAQRFFHFLLLGDVYGHSVLDVLATRPLDCFVYASVPAFVPSVLMIPVVGFAKVFPENIFICAVRAGRVQFLEYSEAFFACDVFAEQFIRFLVGKQDFVGVWVYDVDCFVYSVAESVKLV
jgi:hypothetical protein